MVKKSSLQINRALFQGREGIGKPRIKGFAQILSWLKTRRLYSNEEAEKFPIKAHCKPVTFR